jgi:hypothetical protein
MKSLWSRMRGLVLFGWLVALIRFGIEAAMHPGKSDPTWFIGVYFLMPIAFLVVGLRGTLDDLPWKRIALMSLLLGILVWGIPNAIIYTTAQFLGWTHGRFTPPGQTGAETRAAPIATTAMGKILAGLATGGMTAIAGTIWSLAGTTLLIWLPGVIRRKRAAAGTRA